MKHGIRCWGTILVCVVGAASSARGIDLTVVSIQPARHALNVPISSAISVTFDRAVLPSSVGPTSFTAFGKWSGPAVGTYSFSNGNQTVTLTPNMPFLAGEMVVVVLSRPLQAADLELFRATGYSYMFWTRTRPADISYSLIATLTNRTPDEIANGIPTRIYGALATDLDHDGYPDLTTVNEDSNDLRVLMHSGNPATPYNTFLTPFPISHEASPNEPADFNRDGLADVAAAASSTSTAWVVLGNGDGTFAPPGQEIGVGTTPHGVAVLDVDGDGDTDLVTSNTSSNNLSLMINTNGVMSPATPLQAGCNGEYGLNAADMNNDGIMDLVVGCRFSEDIVIMRGNGNGTFTPVATQDAGGLAWMVVCGDVNGDGNMDVSVANSQSNNGAILLGNGAFGLSLPMITAMPGHAVATDLGDLDGDGDLDWVLSSFGAGIWDVFTNDGSGVFSFQEEITAVSNPSCAILLDFDNDRDLDLALTDEIADLIRLYRNGAIHPLGDFDNDLDVDGNDLSSFASCYSGSNIPITLPCGHGDFDGDGDVDCTDWGGFVGAWTGPGPPPEFSECPANEVPALSRTGLALTCGLILLVSAIMIQNKGQPFTAGLGKRPSRTTV